MTHFVVHPQCALKLKLQRFDVTGNGKLSLKDFKSMFTERYPEDHALFDQDVESTFEGIESRGVSDFEYKSKAHDIHARLQREFPTKEEWTKLLPSNQSNT